MDPVYYVVKGMLSEMPEVAQKEINDMVEKTKLN